MVPSCILVQTRLGEAWGKKVPDLTEGAAGDFSLLSCLLLFQVKDASTQTALPNPTSPRNYDPS